MCLLELHSHAGLNFRKLFNFVSMEACTGYQHILHNVHTLYMFYNLCKCCRTAELERLYNYINIYINNIYIYIYIAGRMDNESLQ